MKVQKSLRIFIKELSGKKGFVVLILKSNMRGFRVFRMNPPVYRICSIEFYPPNNSLQTLITEVSLGFGFQTVVFDCKSEFGFQTKRMKSREESDS